MTDRKDTEGKMYSLAINEPQPLNITFVDGSQLIFPLSGKASFIGNVDESAKIFFDAVVRYRDSQLEAERQRADAVCCDIRIQANDLKSAQTVNKVLQAELAALKDSVGEAKDWEIDHSTDVPILVYKKCSVIESEQAYGLLNLIKQSALKGKQVQGASELIPEGMKYSSALPEFVGDSNEISSYRCDV